MIFPMSRSRLYPISRCAGAIALAAGLSACSSLSLHGDVENRAGAHWSDSRVASFPKGGKTLRGPFLAEPLTLTVRGLPAHKLVKLRFRLIVLGSWDGSHEVWGPDLWSLQVRGGQRLLCTTFSNMGSYNGNGPQSFPDDYPWVRNSCWAGAESHDTLGFPRSSGFSTEKDLNDAVYLVEAVFPHEGDSVTLDFMGNYGDPRMSQQSWGLADFEITTSPEYAALDNDTLAALWGDLASPDPVKANAALWRLASGGDRSHVYVSDRVAEVEAAIAQGERPVPPVRGAEARRLHRAHRLVRILCGERTSDLCYRMERILPEYFR